MKEFLKRLERNKPLISFRVSETGDISSFKTNARVKKEISDSIGENPRLPFKDLSSLRQNLGMYWKVLPLDIGGQKLLAISERNHEEENWSISAIPLPDGINESRLAKEIYNLVDIVTIITIGRLELEKSRKDALKLIDQILKG